MWFGDGRELSQRIGTVSVSTSLRPAALATLLPLLGRDDRCSVMGFLVTPQLGR